VVVRHRFAAASHLIWPAVYFLPEFSTTSPFDGVSSAASTVTNGDTAETRCEAVRDSSAPARLVVESRTTRTGDAAAEFRRTPAPDAPGCVVSRIVICAGARSSAIARPPW